MNSVAFKSNNNEQSYISPKDLQPQHYVIRTQKSNQDIGNDILYGSAFGVGTWTIVGQLQKFLNSNILSKIMIYFGKKIEPQKMNELCQSMYEKSNLGKFGIKTALVNNINGDVNNACYSMADKMVYYTKNTLSALPHEMGHAIIDNKTKVMSFLQKNFYGKPFMLFNYLFLAAIGLKLVTKQSGKEDGRPYGILEKTRNFVDKHYTLIGMLGFAPLLLSEFGASAIAISHAIKCKNFGRGNLLKLIASYGAAFGTYLMATFGTLFLTDSGFDLMQKGKQQNTSMKAHTIQNSHTKDTKKYSLKPTANKVQTEINIPAKPLPEVFKQFAT